MKKFFLSCVFGVSLLACSSAQGADFCICLLEELINYGTISSYDAERHEGNCAGNNCSDPEPTTWYDLANKPPQDCESQDPVECMQNGVPALTAPKPPALDKVAGPDYNPTFAKHLGGGVAKIIHVDCITIDPPDRDPMTAKVFIVFIKARKLKPNQPERPAQILAMGVEVEGLKPSRKADKTTRDAQFANVYHAKVGLTQYRILTTAKKEAGTEK